MVPPLAPPPPPEHSPSDEQGLEVSRVELGVSAARAGSCESSAPCPCPWLRSTCTLRAFVPSYDLVLGVLRVHHTCACGCSQAFTGWFKQHEHRGCVHVRDLAAFVEHELSARVSIMDVEELQRGGTEGSSSNMVDFASAFKLMVRKRKETATAVASQRVKPKREESGEQESLDAVVPHGVDGSWEDMAAVQIEA